MSTSPSINAINYLKGNFLLSKNSIISTIECTNSELRCSQTLYQFSILHNTKATDRNVIKLNIMKPGDEPQAAKNLEEFKQSNLRLLVEKSHQYSVIFIRDCLDDKRDINQTFLKEGGLNAFLTSLEEYKSKLESKRPTILFIEGLELLEFYFDAQEVARFLLGILKKLDYIKQTLILINRNLVSNKTYELIGGLSNSRMIVYETLVNDVDHCNSVRHIVTKSGGYSDIHNFDLSFSKKDGVDYPSFEAKKVAIQANTEEALEKTFKTSFSVSLTEEQRRNKEKLVMPYMMAQNQPDKVKKNLIHLDPDDMDLEQDEDDDLDV